MRLPIYAIVLAFATLGLCTCPFQGYEPVFTTSICINTGGGSPCEATIYSFTTFFTTTVTRTVIPSSTPSLTANTTLTCLFPNTTYTSSSDILKSHAPVSSSESAASVAITYLSTVTSTKTIDVPAITTSQSTSATFSSSGTDADISTALFSVPVYHGLASSSYPSVVLLGIGILVGRYVVVF